MAESASNLILPVLQALSAVEESLCERAAGLQPGQVDIPLQLDGCVPLRRRASCGGSPGPNFRPCPFSGMNQTSSELDSNFFVSNFIHDGALKCALKVYISVIVSGTIEHPKITFSFVYACKLFMLNYQNYNHCSSLCQLLHSRILGFFLFTCLDPLEIQSLF